MDDLETYEMWTGKRRPPCQSNDVQPLSQMRHDLQRLVDEIKETVYQHKGRISVTEAIGALELAKLEIVREQEG